MKNITIGGWVVKKPCKMHDVICERPLGVTKGGRVVKKLEFWGDVIYGWSLMWNTISFKLKFFSTTIWQSLDLSKKILCIKCLILGINLFDWELWRLFTLKFLDQNKFMITLWKAVNYLNPLSQGPFCLLIDKKYSKSYTIYGNH